MAVTKSIHAIVAPWNSSQVADAFKDAFIAAGLMTEWYDSFTSGGDNHRILEGVYDNSKTYGKCYYHFYFHSAGINYKVCAGWDAVNHYPKGPTDVGTQKYDWIDDSSASSSVNSTGHSYFILSLTDTINCSLTRYTSGDRSFFTLRSSTSYQTFTIDPPSTTFRTWYQNALVGGFHTGLWFPQNNGNTGINFTNYNRTKRCLFGGGGARAAQAWLNSAIVIVSYGFQNMNTSAGLGNYYGSFDNISVALPHWYGADMNNGVLSDFLPVFNGIRPGSIYTQDLPDDFGIGGVRGSISNSITIQDTFVVTAGIEEYEVLAFRNSGSTSGAVAPLFLARTVG